MKMLSKISKKFFKTPIFRNTATNSCWLLTKKYQKTLVNMCYISPSHWKKFEIGSIFNTQSQKCILCYSNVCHLLGIRSRKCGRWLQYFLVENIIENTLSYNLTVQYMHLNQYRFTNSSILVCDKTIARFTVRNPVRRVDNALWYSETIKL